MNKKFLRLKQGISIKEILSVTFPIIIDQFFIVSFNFINTLMISSNGQAAISAVNIVGTVNIFFSQMFASVSLAATILIARKSGENNVTDIRKTIINILFVAMTIAIILGLLLFLNRELVIVLVAGQAEQAVKSMAKMYLIGVACSYPLQAFIDSINGSLRGMAKTKLTLKVSLLINFTYVLGNYVFVGIFKLGIIGLCISLILSRVIGVVIAYMIVSEMRSLFDFRNFFFAEVNLVSCKEIIACVFPFMLENIFFNGGKILVQMMIVGLGTQVIAANAIISVILQISEIIPVSIASATVPFVGRFIGQKSYPKVKQITVIFIMLCSTAIFVADIVIFPLLPNIIQLFGAPIESVYLVRNIYQYAIIFHFIFWPISFIVPNALRAMGKGNFTTMVSLFSMWTVRIGIGYLIGIYYGQGLKGILIVTMIEWGVRGVLFTTKFLKIINQEGDVIDG